MKRTSETPKQRYLRRLRRLITNHFDKEELQILCFDLGVKYDTLGSVTLDVKVINLVGYLDRRGRIADLVAYCAKERPHVHWQ
jgi:hypothetical protein